VTIRARPEVLRGGPGGSRRPLPLRFQGIGAPDTTGPFIPPSFRNGNVRSCSSLMGLIDISRSISPATAVWPGDQEVEWTWTSRLGQEDASVNLGAVHLSTHTGSHVDAPYHVIEEGDTTDELPLSALVGPAQVVDVGDASSLRPEHLDGLTAERVLFKTEASFLSDDEWPDTVASFEPETVRHLAANDTVLVGTDAPSVDPLESTTLPAHHALFEAGIVNLEGLCLANVPPGTYDLMALPLKITGADAAPVRAVLRDGEPE